MDAAVAMIDKEVGSILGASVMVRPSVFLARYIWSPRETAIELSLHAVRLPKVSLLFVLFHEAAHRRQHLMGCEEDLFRQDHCANWSAMVQMLTLGLSFEMIESAHRVAAENA